jgi:hypothetical protein
MTSKISNTNWSKSIPTYSSDHWSNLTPSDLVNNAIQWSQSSTNTAEGITLTPTLPIFGATSPAGIGILNTSGAPSVWTISASFIQARTADGVGNIRPMILRYNSNNVRQDYYVNEESAVTAQAGTMAAAHINETIRMNADDYIVVFIASNSGLQIFGDGTRLSITSIGSTSGGGPQALNGRIINVKPSALPRVSKNKSLTVTGMKYAKSRRRKGARKGTVKR